MVVVKKTLRFLNVFFYSYLYRNYVSRNIIMENGMRYKFKSSLIAYLLETVKIKFLGWQG
jgi:hypothetical protein